MFDFSKKFTKKVLIDFADMVQQMQDGIDFKVSSRGWCYLMEQAGYINKSQFDKVDIAINNCRKIGLLPVDFVADEAARAFSGVEVPNGTVEDTLEWMLRDVRTGYRFHIPNWWENQRYYIQILVEKVDLKTLFEPICKAFHIPIANSKGWSSIMQRAEYVRRFKEAEEQGLQPVLLYAGDHDPDGLRISDTIRKNLEQIKDIVWEDGTYGYDPENLIIKRFGINYDFIKNNNYTWIDNLITGSGKDLSHPSHPNHGQTYVKDYIKKIGVRKCEANALVTTPDKARQLITNAILDIIGDDYKDFEIIKAESKESYINLLRQRNLLNDNDDE